LTSPPAAEAEHSPPAVEARHSPPAAEAEHVILCDLDGVVWLAGEAIPGAPEALAELRRRGHRVGFLTNNSSLRIADYVAMLRCIGVPAEPEDVLTSGLAAAGLLAADLAAGARVLCCAGPGVAEALGATGLEAVEEWPCEAVVVGWHRTFDFDRLDRASAAVRRGARFVATNLDPTYPAPDGLIPGNGALVAAVATASGVSPEVAGKPEAPTVALVRRRFGDRGLMVGDRASTDGALATWAGPSPWSIPRPPVRRASPTSTRRPASTSPAWLP
jgi:glycerol-1-phosphatase